MGGGSWIDMVPPSVMVLDGRYRYAYGMTRTHKKVRYSPKGKSMEYTPVTAANGVEQAFKMLEGRWKLMILFHLFGGTMRRFSDLERAIPTISQKMLIQQLRQMEKDGIVRREGKSFGRAHDVGWLSDAG